MAAGATAAEPPAMAIGAGATAVAVAIGAGSMAAVAVTAAQTAETVDDNKVVSLRTPASQVHSID